MRQSHDMGRKIYSSREQKGTILTSAAYRKSLESPIDMGFVPLESLNPDEYDDMCFHKKIQKNPPQKKCWKENLHPQIFPTIVSKTEQRF